jgi:hypothetical protein
MAEMPEETIVDVIDHAGRPWVVTARPFGNQLIVNFLCRSAARRNKVLDQTSVWREEGWELSRRWLPQSPRPVPEPILQLVEIRLKELMRIQKLQAAAWLAQNPPAPAPVADHFPDTTKMVPAATREAVDADTDDVLTLAAIIREVQGTQRQGAAALAEAILSHRAWPALLPSPTREAEPPTPEAAAAMGAHGGPPSEAERLAFEAWMRGHSWSVAGVWNGTTYTGRPDLEPLWLDTAAMQTRMLWAAWRDRAALAAEPTTATEARLARDWYLKGCDDTINGVQDLLKRQSGPPIVIAPPAPAPAAGHIPDATKMVPAATRKAGPLPQEELARLKGKPQPEPNQAPAGDGGLVKEVRIAMARAGFFHQHAAAILAVAKWLRSVGNHGSAAELEREAQRWQLSPLRAVVWEGGDGKP